MVSQEKRNISDLIIFRRFFRGFWPGWDGLGL